MTAASDQQAERAPAAGGSSPRPADRGGEQDGEDALGGVDRGAALVPPQLADQDHHRAGDHRTEHGEQVVAGDPAAEIRAEKHHQPAKPASIQR